MAQLARYRTYLEPAFKTPKTKAYTMLVLSLFAIAFFGLFAIRPTVVTIISLQKEIKQSREVDDKLAKKIDDLHTAEEVLSRVSPKKGLVLQAIPPNPNIALLLRGIEARAQMSGVTLGAMQVRSLNLEGEEARSQATASAQLSDEEVQKIALSGKPLNEIKISLNLTGTEQAIMSFLHELAQYRRIITMDQIRFAATEKSGGFTVELGITAYYQ